MFTAEQAKYMWKLLLPTVILNFFVNGSIGYLTFRGIPSVPMWGDPGVGPDLLGTTFFLTLITFLIMATLVRRSVVAGTVRPWPQARQRHWLAANWPTGTVTGAFFLGVVYLALVGLVVVVLLHSLGPPAYSVSGAVLVKATYSSLLSVLIVPPIVALALREQRYAKQRPVGD